MSDETNHYADMLRRWAGWIKTAPEKHYEIDDEALIAAADEIDGLEATLCTTEMFAAETFSIGWGKGRDDGLEQAAAIANGFTCGGCGMDGKAGAAILKLRESIVDTAVEADRAASAAAIVAAEEAGFLRGIETAAAWHDEQATQLQRLADRWVGESSVSCKRDAEVLAMSHRTSRDFIRRLAAVEAGGDP